MSSAIYLPAIPIHLCARADDLGEIRIYIVEIASDTPEIAADGLETGIYVVEMAVN